MNGFRITVLTLLCLSLAFMFYAVCFVVPSWQGEYNAYQASQRISEYEKKNDIHRQQMVTLDPSYDAPEVAAARKDVEEAARRDDQAVVDAEESNVLAAARRREEEARARAEAEAERDEAVSSATIGIVASYDADWQCIMIRPAVPEAFLPGAVLAVRRDKRVLCEAVVDSRDAESGQVSATVKLPAPPPGETEQGSLAANMQPAVGDEVIASPFPTGDELRAEAGLAPRNAAVSPAAAAADEPDSSRIPPLQAEVPVVEDEPQEQPEATSAELPSELPAEPAAPAEQPAPTTPPPAEDVQRALDVIPTGGSPASSRRQLPSLDAMLHSSMY